MSSNHTSRWAAALKRSEGPAYMAIADAIAADIQSGQLTANQKLPTLRVLATALDLNFTTAARGYAEAQRRGLLAARPGVGTVVREQVRADPVKRPQASSLIDMTMNMPPEPRDAALIERFRDGLASLQRADPYDLLRYQEFGGSHDDRAAGVRWLAPRLPELVTQRVLVCPGVQGALLALFTILARAGDAIACEAVTYPGIKGIATHLGIKLIGLPIDDQGIDPEAFGALCAADPPKALYCNPTLLNPTCATMSLQRRQAIVDIARRHAVPIIEDDAYGFLPAQSPPPLAALAPELTFYITGFAKHLGAGLRIAYLCTPNVRYTARVQATLRTTSVMASPPMVALATRWIDDGTVVAATSAIREESRHRQDIARRVLKQAQYVAHPEAFHLWLSVPQPWNRIEFAAHLRSHGVGVVVSDTFTVSGGAPEAVRVCLGGASSREDCQHSLEIIEDAIEQHPTLASRVM